MPKSVPVRSVPKSFINSWLTLIKVSILKWSNELKRWIQQNWFRLLIIGLLTFILLKKDVSLQLDLQNQKQAFPLDELKELVQTESVSTAHSSPINTAVLSAKKEKQAAYVQRFFKVAQKEMSEFGIPASITLAQGLLETNAGESPLATKNNNHFGLKCFSRSCGKEHCTNFSDDSHKDFFRKFTSAWESYRAHSLLLSKSERYEGLFQLPKTDYKAWANGLKKAGYATDKQYANKLVRLIEGLQLYEYDA